MEDNLVAVNDALRTSITEMPSSLTIFAERLAQSTDIGTYGASTSDVRILIDGITSDAKYLKQDIIPDCLSAVDGISNLYQYYKKYNFREWFEHLPDIIRNVETYILVCDQLVKRQTELRGRVKTHQSSAMKLQKQIKHLSVQFEAEKKQLENKSAVKRSWGIGLAFVPVVNIIASPILLKSSSDDKNNAIEKGHDSKKQMELSKKIDKDMLPALESFIEGITTIATFFDETRSSLKSYCEQGRKASVQNYYEIMEYSADEIVRNCKIFKTLTDVAMRQLDRL